jgi:recombination protein RecA
MLSASAVRLQIECKLAQRIPSALTPPAKMIRPIAATGIETLDDVLKGGLPVGAVSELTGPECSGRTSAALCFLAGIGRAGKVCAWIDVSDAFDPASAAAAGVDLARLLWVRCGVAQKIVHGSIRSFAVPQKYLVAPATTRGLHGGGYGPHPRGEVKGLPEAVGGLLGPEAVAARCAEPQPRVPQPRVPRRQHVFEPAPAQAPRPALSLHPKLRLEQALRATDLLLQGGGFSAIVLDMGCLAPELAARVPLATWFRYRAAAERTQSSILLLTQFPCAKSSAEVLLQFHPAEAICEEATLFSGTVPQVEVRRRRSAEDASNVVPLRKPPQQAHSASWQSRTTWAGRR